MATAADIPAGDIANLRGIITQYFSSRAFYAAATLDVAGALAGGARNIDDLACATGAHAPSLYRVLRVLASSRIFAEGDDGEFVGGCFFEPIPPGAGAYFMKHILHDWGDEECAKILGACHNAMDEKARLLICERIVRVGNKFSSAKLIDLHMMMTTHGGRERTEKEYRTLLATAGFKVARVIPASTPWSVIEAKPAI